MCYYSFIYMMLQTTWHSISALLHSVNISQLITQLSVINHNYIFHLCLVSYMYVVVIAKFRELALICLYITLIP